MSSRAERSVAEGSEPLAVGEPTGVRSFDCAPHEMRRSAQDDNRE